MAPRAGDKDQNTTKCNIGTEYSCFEIAKKSFNIILTSGVAKGWQGV